MLGNITDRINRRKVQLALGGIWVLDGIFQMQPKMFTAQFARKVILPAASGQPALIGDPMHWAIDIFLHQPALFNTLIMLIQLSIGLLILNRKTARIGLILSVPWAFFVWFFGEGLGGIFTGQALLIMGAPGAALIYALLALAVMPGNNQETEDKRPDYRLAYAWMALWMGGAVLLLSSGANPQMLSSMIRQNAAGAPRLLSSADIHFSSWLAFRNDSVIMFSIILYFFIGFSALLKRRLRLLGLVIGILLSLVYWVVGQNLGGYYTGLATDPNTGPLIVLFAIALLGAKVTPLV